MKYENVSSKNNFDGVALAALPKDSLENKLVELKSLKDRRLITSEEFEIKRKQIINAF